MFGRAGLLDGDFDWVLRDFFVEGESAAIDAAIPAVENVFRAAAQGPGCEVEAKRRDGMNNE